MGHIKITKGLDIPIKGAPTGSPHALRFEEESASSASLIALDLTQLEGVKFKVLVRLDEQVKLGQPLVEDKDCPGRMFVSPAGGLVREIRRGLKRRLLYIVIEVAREEAIEQHPAISLGEISRESFIESLKAGGLFAFIRQRPFNRLANPTKMPRSIFVKAIQSAPFTPPAELQVAGYEKEFQTGLEALAKLTTGSVHLVHRQGTSSRAFSSAAGVRIHSAEGPHPIANLSLHIEQIDPIQSTEDVVWTVDAHSVVAIGYFVITGRYFVHRVVSVAGPGVVEGKTGFFSLREGFPISTLVVGRAKEGPMRLISGNPLTGHQVGFEDFLGREDTVFCMIPENREREFLSFFRWGANKYTFSRGYASGYRQDVDSQYDFTTNQHGEHRPFIESGLYDEVMPLNIPTVPLMRAILAEDYDLAVELGLLEVDGEDFALPSFVCPSKIEMVEIVNNGLRRYASEVLS